MDKSMQRVMLGLLAGLLILLLAACGAPATPAATAVPPTATSPPPTATPVPPEPTSTPVPPEPTPIPPAEAESEAAETHTHEETHAHEEAHPEETSAAEAGKELYAAKGCIACHGPEAQGTENGPALPVHTAEQVRRQVRQPLEKMPAFTEEQVSDEELEKIVAFITSLTPAEAMAHGHETSSPIQAHLLMAVISLESDDTSDAQHHLEHALEAADAEQAEAVQRLLDRLNGGDTHTVQHELEEMLAEIHAMEGKTVQQLHLELAYSALEAREIEDCRHHVEHFVDATTGADMLKGQQILKLMDEGELHDARHGIEGLLGMTPHSEH
ncbi:MAG: c-type cytochrome [Anaerolineae bacterium]